MRRTDSRNAASRSTVLVRPVRLARKRPLTGTRGRDRIGAGSHGDSEAQKPKEILALAGARAFPPLMVVLFHFSEGHHYSGVRLLDLLATRGYLWVEFFFVLSGFILTHVYGARLADLFTRRGYVAFLRARLIRLYPLHLFMLLVLAGDAGAAPARWPHAGGYLSDLSTPNITRMSASRASVLSLFLVHAWNTHEHPDLERRLLVRQRGIRALPAVSRCSLAGARESCGAASP